MTEYPTLRHFFKTYMHQGWRDEYANEWAAVDGFVYDVSVEGIEKFRNEIAALLAAHPSEEEVRKVLCEDLRVPSFVEEDGWKYRDWLMALSGHAAVKAFGFPATIVISDDGSYPTLRLFFGAYMYQCWRDEYPDEWALADDFVRAEPLDARHFSAEIAELLASHPEEDQLRSMLLDDFGGAAMVENLGWKYRDWLQAMSAHVAKAIGHPQAS
jgi:hypothetical protein